MEFLDIINEINSKFSISNAVMINKEDGEIIEKFGNTNQVLNDAGAFIGSASEIIQKKIKLKSVDFVSIINDTQIIIINHDNSFIALNISKDIKAIDVFEHYKSIIQKEEIKEEDMSDLVEAAGAIEEVEEEDKLGEEERALIKKKLLQINYLVDEFSKGGDRGKWIENIELNLIDFENLTQAISIENNTLKDKPKVNVAVDKDTIQKGSKKIIDNLCKMAVKEYGPTEAKQMVQNVIKKLNRG